MSLTLMATRSMPTVSWRFSSNASLSLVPTPSVPDTSTGSLLLADLEHRAETAQPAHHALAHGALGKRLDRFDQGIARIDIDAGIAVGQGNIRSWVHGVFGSEGGKIGGGSPICSKIIKQQGILIISVPANPGNPLFYQTAP